MNSMVQNGIMEQFSVPFVASYTKVRRFVALLSLSVDLGIEFGSVEGV